MLDRYHVKWVHSGSKLSFSIPTYGLVETVYVFAIASIGIEREVLIRSKVIKSFDCIDQLDIEIIRNGLILSKIPEPKQIG